jgi:hypothetical protein
MVSERLKKVQKKNQKNTCITKIGSLYLFYHSL